MSALQATTSLTSERSSGDGGYSLAADLIADLDIAEKKLIHLASVIPEDKYGWHPPGARSVRRVLLHIAADNYRLPAMLGFTPDAAIGVTTDSRTALAFEERDLSKDSVIAELTKSFVFMRESLQSTSPASMSASVAVFGQQLTGGFVWILLATHAHELLGQLIAYARTNGVKPPWS